MKRDLFTMQLDLGHELIIDNFAGGGGTSTGLEAAFGRPVDIAINHDPEALAMHAMNHPHTKHLCESVWDVDPIKVTNNQPVALVWLSPDCKHFSKAKGGAPVEKRIRGLAWVALRWAAKCKPRVIMLENVEEFKTWGPLKLVRDEFGKDKWVPDPVKKGKTFGSFIRQLRAHGYHVEWRELRACDFGAPTIRKRLFLVARRDGLPIRWPAPTHGAPDSRGVLAGLLQPHRTAAECIDWSLPCPSIFGRKRPLAEATMRRIAKGIMRYVVDAEKPFIVPLTHQGADRVEAIDEPMRTVTGANRGERALVTAFLNEHANASTQRVFSAAEPMRTICGQVKGGHFGLVSATLINNNFGATPEASMDDPLRTVTTQHNKFGLISAALVGVGGRAGDSRPRGVDEPTATITAKGDTAVGVAFLAKHYTGVVGSELADPIGTVTSTDHHSLVHAHLTKFRTGSTGSDLGAPVPTITAGPKENPAGAPHALGIVTAHIQRDMGRSVGHAADVPLATTTAGGGGKSAVVASTLVKLRGTSSTAAVDEPLHTVSAGGQHHAEVRAFLVKYYGADQDPRLEELLHTVTTKDRFGLVTIHGVDYEIVDIGLRMLAPHELYLAQGFPADYVIEEIPDPTLLFADGVQAAADPLRLPRVSLTKSAQVRMCGNSVCPPVSEALIRANFVHEQQLYQAAA
jgi:DNA (cytosine-5)-methyltransferase 1